MTQLNNDSILDEDVYDMHFNEYSSIKELYIYLQDNKLFTSSKKSKILKKHQIDLDAVMNGLSIWVYGRS